MRYWDAFVFQNHLNFLEEVTQLWPWARGRAEGCAHAMTAASAWSRSFDKPTLLFSSRSTYCWWITHFVMVHSSEVRTMYICWSQNVSLYWLNWGRNASYCTLHSSCRRFIGELFLDLWYPQWCIDMVRGEQHDDCNDIAMSSMMTAMLRWRHCTAHVTVLRSTNGLQLDVSQSSRWWWCRHLSSCQLHDITMMLITPHHCAQRY